MKGDLFHLFITATSAPRDHRPSALFIAARSSVPSTTRWAHVVTTLVSHGSCHLCRQQNRAERRWNAVTVKGQRKDSEGTVKGQCKDGGRTVPCLITAQPTRPLALEVRKERQCLSHEGSGNTRQTAVSYQHRQVARHAHP